MVDFGMRLKTLREAKKLNQSQLAERMGVTKSMISAYENSIRMPSYNVLIRFAGLFGVSVDYLLGVDRGEVINVSGLTERQREIVVELIYEFKGQNKEQ
ncbi:MAG: helix-turn-helix transcriptional regulator [Clostridia bacterium]|nr:helix-turn-helix transcriptional regulator [Clostridia bacterium]